MDGYIRGGKSTTQGRDSVRDLGQLGSLVAACQEESQRMPNRTMIHSGPHHGSRMMNMSHMVENGIGTQEASLHGMNPRRIVEYSRPLGFGRAMDGHDPDHGHTRREHYHNNVYLDPCAKKSSGKRQRANGIVTGDASQEMPVAKKKNGGNLPRRGRKKYMVDDGVLGKRAIEMLGQRNKSEAEQYICTMTRIQLHRAFEMLYNVATESSNNAWLRNKLLQAIESRAEYVHGSLVRAENKDDPLESIPFSQRIQEDVVGSGEERHGVMLSPKRQTPRHLSGYVPPNGVTHANALHLQDGNPLLENEDTWDTDCALAKGQNSSSKMTKSDHQDAHGIVGGDGAIDGKYRCTEHSSSRWNFPAFHGQQRNVVAGVSEQVRASTQTNLGMLQAPINDSYGWQQSLRPNQPPETYTNPYVGPTFPAVSRGVPSGSTKMNAMDSSNASLPTLHQLAHVMDSMEKHYYAKSIQESLQRLKYSDYDMFAKIVGEVSDPPLEYLDSAGVQEQMYRDRVIADSAPKHRAPTQHPYHRLAPTPPQGCFVGTNGHHASYTPTSRRPRHTQHQNCDHPRI